MGTIGERHVGVIGGGIVGMAIARALTQRGVTVTVLEKEDRLAAHQTGHNSGVAHAGLYYPPGSLKATLCTRGRELLREYCAERGLPYRELGKLVVATKIEELPGLDRIEERARANGVPGLVRFGPEAIREIEPHVAGLAALHSPRTAVVDFVAVTNAMADDVRAAGGSVLVNAEVTSIRPQGDRVEVSTDDRDFQFDSLVVCAGLQADRLAVAAGASADPAILPFRGEYRILNPARAYLVRGMVYPVPDPAFPFLGVHFTRGVDDSVHVGPNAVPALAREGYRWRTVSARETWAAIRWPGSRPLARRHWATGSREIVASLVKPLFVTEARRFIPELRVGDLGGRTDSGVRAQACDRAGRLLDDFAIDRVGPVTLLRNAPSPAATSSLAIADHVVDEVVLAS